MLILTHRFNDWVIQLHNKITNLSICLAQQNDHEILFKEVQQS